MINEVKDELLEKAEGLRAYLSGLKVVDSIPFTKEETDKILEVEAEQSAANYRRAISKFQESNQAVVPPKSKRFVVYWGLPGAGKSVMAQKLIGRFGREEDCLPFNIIDKDQHRDLFPNLFEHLRNGHIDECEKFAGVTIDYVRKILDLSLAAGERSILSIGSMGAGSEFQDNAMKAISCGYRPCAVYMAVKPEIAYLSSAYRSAVLYDQIIFQNKELYPRLVSDEYFTRVVKMLPQMIEKIDNFQQEHSEHIDLMVLNRNDDVLYDSKGPHRHNVWQAIRREEERELAPHEVIGINRQLTQIERNIRYRAENGVYAPAKSEVAIIQKAVTNIMTLIENQPQATPTPFMQRTGTDGR